MADMTKIEWTDFTVNFWEGCQKVGPGCDHCYAEARDMRFTGGEHWGPGAPRRKVKSGIPKLRKINREAEAFRAEHGHWPRVFCSSLSDVFDNAVDKFWRDEAFMEMTLASKCRIILLTKRVGNVEAMVPPIWVKMQWPPHIGLMITVVNQAEADRDIPKLLDLKARLGIRWVGLSIEPMLGEVDLTHIAAGWHFINALEGFKFHDADRSVPSQKFASVDWVICGGESGVNARPMHPDWARTLRDQCVQAGTAFLFKQWGEWAPGAVSGPNTQAIRAANLWNGHWDYVTAPAARHDDHIDDEPDMFRIGKKRAGRLLDSRTWDQFPEALT